MKEHKDGFYGFGFLNLFRRNNDAYTVTPTPSLVDTTNLNKGPQYVTVDGKEASLLDTTPQLSTVIRRRANMMANGRFVHLDRNDEPIEDSEIVKLLMKPNPVQAGNEWLIQQDIQKSCYGNTFMYFLRGSSLAVPSAIWNLPPSKMSIQRTGKIWQQTDIKDIIEYYEIYRDSNDPNIKDKFDPVNILHRNIQDVDDPILGRSPFHALHMPISNIRGAYGFRNVLIMEKGAIGMIVNKSKNTSGALPLTPQERETLENQFAHNYGITSQQRKIIMSSAQLGWESMSFPTKELMLFEEVDEDTRQIIDFYGLNEAIFSLGKGTTFDNYREGEKAAYQDTVIPEAKDLTFGMSEKLGLLDRGERLMLDYSHIPILQEDQQKEATILREKSLALRWLMDSGLFSADEIKEILKF